MTRPVPLLLILAFVLSACGRLGVGRPDCGADETNISVATVMQAQAVPTADWGPCIADLAPGWSLHLAEPERGRAGFWIDSDRMGIRFLDVRLEDSCEPLSDAAAEAPPNDEIRRLVSEVETPEPLRITVVPVASRHTASAFAISKELAGTGLDGHRISALISEAGSDPAERIAAALADGQQALVIDDESLVNGVLELRSPDGTLRIDTLDELLDELADDLEPPTYRATWWHVFDGGCVTFEFDAHGHGADTVAGRVLSSVGFFPLDEVREVAAENDLYIGPPP